MAPCRHNFATRRRRYGFTFVELMLGLVITALVMGALASVLSAVAQGWKQSGLVQSNTNTTAQVHLRLARTLKAVNLIGAVRSGSTSNNGAGAAALLWKSDANYDWKIQFSEMALLEYRPAGALPDPNTLRLYQVTFPAGWTAAQKQAADTTLGNNDEIYADSEIDLFKNLQYVTYATLARNVKACAFHKNDSSATTRPSLDYQVLLSRDGTDTTEMGTVALRSPSTLPVSQR